MFPLEEASHHVRSLVTDRIRSLPWWTTGEHWKWQPADALCLRASLTCKAPGSYSSQDTKCFWHSSLHSCPHPLNFCFLKTSVSKWWQHGPARKKSTLPTDSSPIQWRKLPPRLTTLIFWLAQTLALRVWGCKWGRSWVFSSLLVSWRGALFQTIKLE